MCRLFLNVLPELLWRKIIIKFLGRQAFALFSNSMRVVGDIFGREVQW
jgi:hypothetical protein